MKIYTKTGDSGETSLFNGERKWKDDPRIEAYGTVDELNAQLGLLIAKLPKQEYKSFLLGIQQSLFNLGALLANPDTNSKASIQASDIEAIENEIDNLNTELPELRAFILPGGNELGALTHVVRTVCRRAERRTITLAQLVKIDPITVKYLNRLSDYFFVLSRKLVHEAGDKEIQWLP